MADGFRMSRTQFQQKRQQNRNQWSSYFNKDMRNWIMIYPVYINSKREISRGRLLPLTQCVDNPTVKEIADVLSTNSFEFIFEDSKVHPKEPLRDSLHIGRVRVRFWSEGENGREALHAQFPTRKSLMAFVAEEISMIHGRQSTHAPASATNTQTQKGKKNQKAATSGGGGSGGGGGGQGKKSKKGKK